MSLQISKDSTIGTTQPLVIFGEFKLTPWYDSPGYFGSRQTRPAPYQAREPAIVWSGMDIPSETSGTTNCPSKAHVSSNSSTTLRRLFICDFCFKYCGKERDMVLHRNACTRRVSTPGKLVYDDGIRYQINEIDGDSEKLYCQCLSLFAKFFLDSKSVVFAVDGFLFYVIVERTSRRVMGFFSKEKNAWDDYNLACILVFPPFQSRGLGRLLIAFSYYLSRLTNSVSSPEKPLSSFGYRSYLSYWCIAVSQYLLTVENKSDNHTSSQEDRMETRAKRAPIPTISLEKIAQATGIDPSDVMLAIKSMNGLSRDGSVLALQSIRDWADQHQVFEKCLLSERYCMY